MKKNRKDFKLTINRETLLALEHPELRPVAGGLTLVNCPSVEASNCNTCETRCC